MADDEDDTQYMLAQDPGYLLAMQKEIDDYIGKQRQKEHSKSLDDYLAKLELEEEYRKEEAYWADRDEWYQEKDDGSQG